MTHHEPNNISKRAYTKDMFCIYRLLMNLSVSRVICLAT